MIKWKYIKKCEALHQYSVYVCDVVRFTEQNAKVNMRDQQWVSQCDRMKAIRKKRCKQNRKCFHYVENLVIRSLFALNACCFGYWLFICNKNKKNNAFSSYKYILPLRTRTALFFRYSYYVKKCFFFSPKKKRKNRILLARFWITAKKIKTNDWRKWWEFLKSTFIYIFFWNDEFSCFYIWLLSNYNAMFKHSILDASLEIMKHMQMQLRSTFHAHSPAMQKINYTFISNN